MRNIFLAILATILLCSTAARASDVLVVQGLRVNPFEEAFRGFRETCDATTRRVYLSDYAGQDLVKAVRRASPRLILAIGADALARLGTIRDIPIVYVMVLNPQSFLDGNSNVIGIDMNVPPEKYLDLLAQISPSPKRIGIIYDPARTGSLVQRTKRAASARGIEIKSLAVNRASGVPKALNSFEGGIDALLMLPDMTVVTPETVESFLLFSQNNNVPVFAFAAKYVAMGALLALDIDSTDQGRQAGEIARLILAGKSVAAIPRTEARLAHLKLNRTVAKKLGLTVDTYSHKTSIRQP